MSSSLPDSTLRWLLQPDNPPVRHLTLTEILRRDQADPAVRQASEPVHSYKPTQTILGEFEDFRNDDRERSYKKYTGKYWQLIFLGQLRADGHDPRVVELVRSLIEQQDWVLIRDGGQCLTSNLLSALTLLGYEEDPAVQEAAVKLAERLLEHGGIDCTVMEYSLLPFCYMAQPKLLLCFAQMQSLRHHPAIAAAIAHLSENLVAHQISVYVPGHRKQWLEVLAAQPPKSELGGRTMRSWLQEQKKRFLAEKGLGQPTEKPGWLKFGFPLHYNSDLLEALYALALAGTPMCEPLRRPLAMIREKMSPDGRLILENSLNGKMRADVEEVRKPSKWLTYRAWYVLQHFERN